MRKMNGPPVLSYAFPRLRDGSGRSFVPRADVATGPSRMEPCVSQVNLFWSPQDQLAYEQLDPRNKFRQERQQKSARGRSGPRKSASGLDLESTGRLPILYGNSQV